MAEFAAMDANLLAPSPANLTMREAAALPLILITAWESLVDRARACQPAGADPGRGRCRSHLHSGWRAIPRPSTRTSEGWDCR